MDFYDLERANKIREQISELDKVVVCLETSIRNHGQNSKLRGYKRLFRFVNCKLREEAETEARIFLFSGLSFHGIEIPVDQEICEKVLEIFQNRLEEKQKEFAMIGERRSDG